LEKITDKRIFEILIMDVSNLDSVRKAVNSLDEPIDGLVMNAGGTGGKEPGEMTEYGVPAVIAVNVLGHVLLVDLLLEQNKLSGTVIFSGSEAARGVPLMGMKKYEFKSGSVAEFESMINGSAYKKKTMEEMYGPAKLVGTFWMSSMARKHPDIRFITVSPGGTTGTTFERDLPGPKKFMMKRVMFPLLSATGKIHKLPVGAKRYVDALVDDDRYQSGVFYASKKGVTGKISDQVSHAAYLADTKYQDNANVALHKFVKTGAAETAVY
jgi:NAD(P)-dependent dehydrogenase (short-subunit alcohol dehydrogenase family)